MSEATHMLRVLCCVCTKSLQWHSHPPPPSPPIVPLTFQRSCPLILDEDARPKDLVLWLHLDSSSIPFFETGFPASSERWERQAHSVRKRDPCFATGPLVGRARLSIPAPLPQPAHHSAERATATAVSQALAAAWFLFLCIFIHKIEQTREWLKVKKELSITTGKARNKSQNIRLVLVDNFNYVLQWALTLNWKFSCCWKIEGLQHPSDKVRFKDEFYFS